MPTAKKKTGKAPVKKSAQKVGRGKPAKKAVKMAVPTPKAKPSVGAKLFFYANGKRKTSIARVRLFPSGTGQVTVNGVPLQKFAKTTYYEQLVLSPLIMAGKKETMDVVALVEGGGFSSSADAVRHGISKALVTFDPELRKTLKKVGYLRRDSRVKERKKYGRKRARRGQQFSKR